MGSIFRSEEMSLLQLFIQPEAAYSTIAEFGETGLLQFRDLNEKASAFQKRFVTEVRRCDELQRKLTYIQEETQKFNIPTPEADNTPEAPDKRELLEMEAHLENLENELLEVNQNSIHLKENFLELTELKYVLEKAKEFFTEVDMYFGEADPALERDDIALCSDKGIQAGGQIVKMGFVAGVIPREKLSSFERMLWRISRGNVFLRQADIEQEIEDPVTGKGILKSVFIAYFQGEQLRSRVKKICQGYHCSLYPCPDNGKERGELYLGLLNRLDDINKVLSKAKDHSHRVLVEAAKHINTWVVKTHKMKAIYHIMNMFNVDFSKKCLIAECWAPTSEISAVNNILIKGSKASGSSVSSFLNIIPTSDNPPTFHRTNKFSQGFQNLIDAYGVASYREVNPALYTIITFPFLFGVMFGDCGHGIIVAAFALFMILKEKQYMKDKSGGEIWNIFFGGRYIILLMGFFSIYTGLIYNDMFSKSFNIFGSAWRNTYDNTTLLGETASLELEMNPKDNYIDYPYEFGVDPIWQMAKNKIIFLNGYKMKLSIILGIIHMLFGLCFGVVNHLYFRRGYAVILESLPQFVFLCSLFLYLVVLIFVKWITYGPNFESRRGTACAPSILILFINMFLFGKTERKNCDTYMFPNEDIVEIILLVLAVLCIPVLLFGKPVYLILKRRKRPSHVNQGGKVNEGIELQGDVEAQQTHDSPSHGGGHDDHDNMEVGELMILQGIHTIEYVLSCISHTASYLRLWALSLAHAQLSEVLWTMVFNIALTTRGLGLGAIMIYVIFACWAVLTVCILVLMEGLSAFLHTLRLHWVEFDSKFYAGEGHAFQPFSFKIMLEEGQFLDE